MLVHVMLPFKAYIYLFRYTVNKFFDFDQSEKCAVAFIFLQKFNILYETPLSILESTKIHVEIWDLAQEEKRNKYAQ